MHFLENIHYSNYRPMFPVKFLLVCAVAVSFAIPVQAKTLLQDEILNELVGVEFKFRNKRGTKGFTKMHSDGKFNWRNERGLKGAGEWRFEGNKLCSILFKTVAFKGRGWKCQTVKKRADGRYRIGSNTWWK